MGATSKVGRPIIRSLREKGRAVRAMTRAPEAAADLADLGAEVVPGDLIDAASLERACAGASCAIATAHSFFGKGPHSSKAVDRDGHRALIDSAAAAGVQRFVYVSAAGVGPDSKLDFARFKYETEEHLKASGMAYTIVRGSAFMESWLLFSASSFLRTGEIKIFGPGDRPANFVSAEDVAKLVVLVLERDDALGCTLEIGGPENLSPLELVEMLERITGKRARPKHVPLALVRILSWLYAPIHPGMSRAMRATALGAWSDSESEPPPPVPGDYPIELSRFEDVARRMLATMCGPV